MERNYFVIIEKWIRYFIKTMNANVIDGCAKQGEDSGEAPTGIKIIFDGYGYNEKTDSHDDINMISFAVFIHKNSLNDFFPEHETSFNMILHRPSDECCIYVWYNVKENYVEVLPLENSVTEIDHELLKDLIFKIDDKNPSISK